MRLKWRRLALLAVLVSAHAAAQETHDHPVPEKLGQVSFATSCQPGVQAEFNRAVALLHSFAYSAQKQPFKMSQSSIRNVQWRVGESR